MSHRSQSAWAGVAIACAAVAFSAPALAQTPPPAADCMKTETQAECHTRLKCKPDEELEDCKKRLRGGEDRDGKAGQGDADKQGGDRDDADKKPRDRDRGDADKKPRDRDRRRRDDDKKPRARGGRVDNDRGRGGGGRHRGDDDGGHAGGGGGGILRRGTHPWFFSGGIGPSWGFCYHGHCGPRDVDYAAFYGTLDFGYHFSGSFKGPAIGANIHGGYGSFGPFSDGRFGAGFKFWWDIPMANDLGLYFTPFAQAGWSSFIFESRRSFGCDPRFFDCSRDWEHFFNVQFGAQVRMVLGNRGLLYVQPITFDNVINGDGYGLLYHFEIGGGVIFGG